MAPIWTLQSHSFSFQISSSLEVRREFGLNCSQLKCNRKGLGRKFMLRAISSVSSDDKFEVVKTEKDATDIKNPVGRWQDIIIRVGRNPVGRLQEMIIRRNPVGRLQEMNISVGRLQEMIISSPPVIFMMKRRGRSNIAVGLFIAVAFLVVSIRVYAARKSRHSRPGSVADLVRRGQLRSDRRGISSPLMYDDPFNNPMVKVSKNNSSVEMCGKVYRLSPVTLTKEQQTIHQKRRSRAYQWKRPTMFLKEGDSAPPDVDPDTIRWIPANHPFATIASEIDEDLAQTNVYQKHGVPSRIQAEHEALQRKLEALQIEQKFNKVAIDPGNAKDFETPFKSNSRPLAEESPSNNQTSNPLESDHAPPSLGNNLSSEER